MQHPFVTKSVDRKPLKDLISEYKAEVVEEVTEEHEDDIPDVCIQFFMHFNLSCAFEI